jgi:tRNA A-37 threonylcarbamoyl transferase component Bud32
MSNVTTSKTLDEGQLDVEEGASQADNSMISDKVYQNIEKIVGTLWKLKVSHNDLSINNIMIGKNGNIKLLDFGLSEILNKPINNAQEYQELFANIKKDEQSGSNVAKLKELYSLLHQ